MDSGSGSPLESRRKGSEASGKAEGLAGKEVGIRADASAPMESTGAREAFGRWAVLASQAVGILGARGPLCARGQGKYPFSSCQ